MSRDNKINNIISYAIILLIHLMKQQAEGRNTHYWDVYIRNSFRQIKRKNKRRKAGGYYLQPEELASALESAYPDTIDEASLYQVAINNPGWLHGRGKIGMQGYPSFSHSSHSIVNWKLIGSYSNY